MSERNGRSAVLHLPGSVAEVDASPEGPEIAAVFDLDGTLVAGFTAAVHTSDRVRRREIGPGEFLRMLQTAVDYRLGRLEFESLIEHGAKGMAGRSLSDLDELGERLFRQKIADLVYPEVRELVRAHQRRGHTVVLASSATSVQVEPVARYLGIDEVLCNRFTADEQGLMTGGVETPILWGSGKADAVQRLAADRGVDLQRSYFYADGDEDLALMYLVGNPRPTNPRGKLAAVAQKRGWPVLRFTSRGAPGPIGRLRSLAAIGSVVPIAAGSLSLGLLTGDKRRGVNLLSSAWPSLLLSMNGVRLRVVGRENLDKQRPAVFIFNHRNNFDPFMVASLVRHDYTGVAKKELEDDPIAGRIGRLMDVVFIDRANSSAAVQSLKDVEAAIEKGLSVLIAPEGTRLDTSEVGPFKKGAFRMAMAAGVPIVPIVIRNAESIGGQNATAMNPGTVDVAVLPPIPVEDWRLRDLNQRMEEVRQLYLETLQNWPTEDDEKA
jgi:putative phosphoserine phosphatase/1-acylglycerol-3-phosphate O-acyltransferase